MNETASEIIISLTSYPARIRMVDQVIRSLLDQTVQPWKIVLWLTREEFPEGEKELPERLLSLTHGTIFEIDWCENMRAYNKLIPALRKYPDCAIVTVDDDIVYSPDTLEQLLAGYKAKPSAIQAMRTHLITSRKGKISPYVDWIKDSQIDGINANSFLTGVGGVLYPPRCFDSRILDLDLAKELTPLNDDIWYWAMAVLSGTPINAISAGGRLDYVAGSQKVGLRLDNVDGGENDHALKRVLARFPEIKKRLSMSYPPLPKTARHCGGMIRSIRDGNRLFSVRLNVPLFQMKYNEDYSILTYYVLKIPFFRRRCSRSISTTK